MFENSYLQVGAGRYLQHPGALQKLGGEAACWGRKAYIVTDETVWNKTHQRVEQSLQEAGIAWEVDLCELPSTQHTFDTIAQRGEGAGADIYIGLGGGRCIDIAKGASAAASKRVITCPTSPATCAAFAVLYVTYGEDGFVQSSQWLPHESSAVLVDTDYAALDCPPRYIASGIADAMAKKPEFIFTMQRLGTGGQIATSRLAVLTGEYTWNLFLEQAPKAMEDLQRGECSKDVDDVLCACLMLTGMVSDLSTGGKSLALAHNFYDAVCGLRGDVRKNFLHGELVGLSIPMQMYVNGAGEEEIEEFHSLMRTLKVPTTLAEVGITGDTEALVQCTYEKTGVDDPALLQKIREGFRVMQRS